MAWVVVANVNNINIIDTIRTGRVDVHSDIGVVRITTSGIDTIAVRRLPRRKLTEVVVTKWAGYKQRVTQNVCAVRVNVRVGTALDINLPGNAVINPVVATRVVVEQAVLHNVAARVFFRYCDVSAVIEYGVADYNFGSPIAVNGAAEFAR